MPPLALHQTSWLSVIPHRLNSVGESLVRFRDSPQDSEALHDLRVACRRAESALRVCCDLLPPDPAKWLRKHLREVRRLSNASRDNEVLRKWLKGQAGSFARNLRKSLKSEGQQQRVSLVECIRDVLRGNRWAEHVERVGSSEGSGAEDHTRRLIARRLREDLFRFVESLPTEATSPSELHQFRIAGKRLRYSIECVCEMFPAVKCRSLHRILPQIQERLGQLHDLDVRLVSLKPWVRDAGASPQWQESIAESQRLLISWQAWWRSVAWESAVGTALTELLRFSRATKVSSTSKLPLNSRLA